MAQGESLPCYNNIGVGLDHRLHVANGVGEFHGNRVGIN
ncbi:hypothetical protein LINGRAHAP2_LOCUS28847 [Linum grandiflorum]